MKFRMFLVLAMTLMLASAVMGQTKVSGAEKCNVPNPNYSVNVGDRADHSITLMQNTCDWTKPMEVDGIQSKQGHDTTVAEMTKTAMRFHGFHVSTMANGDKCFVRYQGSAPMVNGKPGNSSGTWSYDGGTGKFRSIKGKGNFKGTPAEDGSETVEVEGEYTLPARK
ncbi:MAG: hypothetical protein PHX83_17660 [Acidobacteriia bacterium]|nr:hypothetical protein [Terriglobia bacterium]